MGKVKGLTVYNCTSVTVYNCVTVCAVYALHCVDCVTVYNCILYNLRALELRGHQDGQDEQDDQDEQVCLRDGDLPILTLWVVILMRRNKNN
jgi:hypothetical protein